MLDYEGLKKLVKDSIKIIRLKETYQQALKLKCTLEYLSINITGVDTVLYELRSNRMFLHSRIKYIMDNYLFDYKNNNHLVFEIPLDAYGYSTFELEAGYCVYEALVGNELVYQVLFIRTGQIVPLQGNEQYLEAFTKIRGPVYNYFKIKQNSIN